MDEALLPSALRRVPLKFDDNGEPVFDTVCSPKSFRVRAHAVVPPRHVIPVIFVPGVMGTNLRENNGDDSKKQTVWRPPNGTIEALGEVRKRKGQQPKCRQLQMMAASTEVDDRGKVELPEGVLTLTKDEAVRRGWGALHFDSYGHVLAELERSLNDQYEDAGKAGAKKMAVWEVELRAGHDKDKFELVDSREPATNSRIFKLSKKLYPHVSSRQAWSKWI